MFTTPSYAFFKNNDWPVFAKTVLNSSSLHHPKKNFLLSSAIIPKNLSTLSKPNNIKSIAVTNATYPFSTPSHNFKL